ncbi:MAG: Ldh family oxidoreductase [Pseudoxanthomonas sp.]
MQDPQNEMLTLGLAEAQALAEAALRHAGIAQEAARMTAEALVLAEADGLSSHGLARLPFYLAQVHAGKVNANAHVQLHTRGACVRVDADHGFAFPAVSQGLEVALERVRELGVVLLAIGRSHHFGVAGHPVERAARAGVLAMAFANAPAAIAPWGGHTPLFGTDPVAFAAPRAAAPPLVIDLSLSKVARGKVMLARQQGQPIPADWALDVHGQPTTDAQAALAGSMLPAGEAKGAALALMVELLTAGLTGSHFAFQASSLFDAEGPPPSIAHTVLLVDPTFFAPGFVERAELMFNAIQAQEGARLPGSRRWALRAQHQREGIGITRALYEALLPGPARA